MSPHLRETTHFSELSNELGELENLQRLCVVHLFMSFSIESFCLISPTQQAKFCELWIRELIPALWNSLQPWILIGLLKKGTLTWKCLALPERADQKFQQQLAGKTALKKAPGSPWVRSCCHYDCFKCTATADYWLIFLCKSLTGLQTSCAHLISASIKACTSAKVISNY